MRVLFSVLSGLVGLYSLLIFVRILLTWFNSGYYGKPAEILSRLTDPYLGWWQRNIPIRAGLLDLSPIAAIAALSIIQSVFSTIALYGRISLGIILAVALMAVWSALSFILGFCFVIVALRFIAYMTSRNIYSPFWRVIDSISSPILYRINRVVFGRRPVNYMTGMITAALVLAAIWIGGRFTMRFLANLLLRLPI